MDEATKRVALEFIKEPTSRTSIACFAFCAKGVRHFSTSTACYAQLAPANNVRPGLVVGNTLAAATCWEFHSKFNREHAIRFYGWLFGETSPYRSLFDGEQRDPEEVADYGFIIERREDTFFNLLYDLCIAFRFPTEFPHLCKEWVRLCDQGIDPGLAFWGAHFDNESEHTAVSVRRAGESYVKNLIKGYPERGTTESCFPATGVWGDESGAYPLISHVWPKLYPKLVTAKLSKYSWAPPMISIVDFVQVLKEEQKRLAC